MPASSSDLFASYSGALATSKAFDEMFIAAVGVRRPPASRRAARIAS